LILDTDEVLHNIQSLPHSKGSKTRPSVSIPIPSMGEKTGGGQNIKYLDEHQVC
jgi:hypothetical protein